MDKVCHFEIPTSDKDRAHKFYADVFGWQVMPAPSDMPYWFAITTAVDEENCPTEPGGINGGFYERGEQGSTTPVLVMEVENTEQKVKDIEAAGGSVVLPTMNVGDMGMYAQVKDTEDNIIGLWQPLNKG